jgi:serine/threonine protein kinase
MKKMDKYQKIGKINEGTYGEVYKYKDSNGEFYAFKKIKIQSESEGTPSTVIREISLLKELQHKNIVNLLDVIHDGKKIFLVFEFLDQDLKNLIDKIGVNGLDRTTYQVRKSLLNCSRFFTSC